MPDFRFVVLAMLAIVCGVAHAQPYAATLSGTAVEPPNGSPGTGTARVTFDSTFKTLKVEVSFSGLSSGTTRAQLHCCGVPPGNTIAATQLPGLDRFPAGVVNGIHAQLLDLTAASSFNPAFVAANGGTVASAAAALATGLANGQAYLSISTSLFPAGEIRSFLLPANLLFVDGFETPAATLSLLRCDSPADGALVDLVPGPGAAVTGTALGLSNVQVNGTPVTVAADRTFSSTVTGRYGMNFVELSGTDGAGAARTTLCAFLGAQNWITEGLPFNGALLFRAEQTGLQKITSRYSLWFSRPELAQNLHASLLAGNPLVEINCGAFGSCVREIHYLSLANNMQLQSINLSATTAQRLNVRVAMDIPLRVRVHSQNGGIGGTHEGTVTFDNAVFDVDVILGIDPVTGIPTVSGQINTASPGTVAVQFQAGFNPEFLQTVIDECFSAVNSRIDVLGGATGLFAGLFAGMDLTLPAAGFPVGRLDGTGNVAMALARRSSVGLQNGGLRVSNSLRVATPPPPAGAIGRFPFPQVSEPVSRPGVDAWSAAHVGIFNQVLQALWRVGAFDGTIDGTALGAGLPPGTSLQVQLRTMPTVIGFGAAGMTSLDVGALDLVVTHPSLPPALRVTAGARISAQGALASGDFVFTDFLAQEQFASTGAVTLSAAQRSTLMDLLNRLFLKLGGVALNDSLPVVPATVFTFPLSLAPYGLTPGNPLVSNPSLGITPNYLFLEGAIGIVP